MGKPLSYEYVKSYIESKSCELLSETYEGTHSKLKIRCKWQSTPMQGV